MNIGGVDLTDPVQKQELLRHLFSDPTLLPAELKSWVPNWAEQNIQLPVDQLVGFKQFSATAATAVLVAENSSLTAYHDLATVGPYMTGLPDGSYVVTWGAGARSNNGNVRAKMSISIDGQPPDDTTVPQAYTLSTSIVGVSSSYVFQLQGLGGGGGGHTIKCQYAVGNNDTANGLWDGRWMTVHQVSQ